MTPILQEKMLKITEHLNKLKTLYNVERIGFFGSITRGDFSPKSDIDMLVEFNTPIGFFKFLQLERELSALLGYKVDLVTRDAIKPAIKASIISQAVYV